MADPAAQSVPQPDVVSAPPATGMNGAAAKGPRKFDRTLVEGPIGPAVWKLAWPTMLQNIFAGLQGIIDHIMVGHYVDYRGNAAIGVSWQIILVVVVFISSLFIGMGVLVARFAGQNDPEKVNRTVYQAFITAFGLAILMGTVGYLAAPSLLNVVNAAPEVQVIALPFLRAMFLGIFGMMMFFMLCGAFRAAGDAKTPLYLGIAMTVLTVMFNVILIPRLGAIGAALGTILSSTLVSAYGVYKLFRPESVIQFHRGMDLHPDMGIIRELFKFGLPAGIQGIAMNVGGVLMLRFIGSLEHSAAAQAAYAVGYTQLFSLMTWTSNALMGSSATIAGQNLGAGHPDRAKHGVAVAARIGLLVALVMGVAFFAAPHALLAIFGMTDPVARGIGALLLRYLAFSGFFITVALSYTGGLQGTGDTKSPLYISIVSQVLLPIGLCAFFAARGMLTPGHIWSAIVVGHFARAVLSVVRFRQGKWRNIAVNIAPARG
jgi:putative MATE family efflux protein